MRISELAEQSGVSIPAIKYYLREKLLPPGVALNARESAYNEDHLQRLRLIRGLIQVTGASIDQVRQLLDIIQTPDQTALEVVARSSWALAGGTPDPATTDPRSQPTQRAEALLQRLGMHYFADSPNLRALQAALDLAEEVGLPTQDEQLSVYVRAAQEIAKADFDRIPWDDPQAAAERAVLGTVLYEPVLTALRRLAHQELAGHLEDAE